MTFGVFLYWLLLNLNVHNIVSASLHIFMQSAKAGYRSDIAVLNGLVDPHALHMLLKLFMLYLYNVYPHSFLIETTCTPSPFMLGWHFSEIRTKFTFMFL